MLPIFLATYGTVFVAEIVGDKLLYTTGVLAARYRTVPIMFGMAFAFMLKMGVAVYVSKFISHLPPWLVASITAINFIAIAIVLWRKPDKREIKQYPASRAVGGIVRRHLLFGMGRRGAAHGGRDGIEVSQRAAAGVDRRRGGDGDQGDAGGVDRRGRAALDPGARFSQRSSDTRQSGCCCFLGLLSVIETLTDERAPGLLLGLMR